MKANGAFDKRLEYIFSLVKSGNILNSKQFKQMVKAARIPKVINEDPESVMG